MAQAYGLQLASLDEWALWRGVLEADEAESAAS